VEIAAPGVFEAGPAHENPVFMAAINDTEQTFLRITVAEGVAPAEELSAIAGTYQSRVRALGMQNAQGKQYSAHQLAVGRAEAPAVVAAVSALGQVTFQQTDPVLLSGRYQELWEQNLQLEQKLQTASDRERTTLAIRQQGAREEMSALARQAEEIVIVVWVEQ
jgi:hypothetical protein